MIARGCGDKIGIVYGSLFQFFFGIVVAFIIGYEFALILLFFLPFIGILAKSYGSSIKTGMVEKMKAYTQSAGYAE